MKARRRVRPSEALSDALRDAGVGRVMLAYPANRRRLLRLGLQAAAVDMLVHEYSVCKAPPRRCRVLLSDGRVEIAVPSASAGDECVYVLGARPCERVVVDWRDVAARLPNPPIPSYTIDMSFLDMHTPRELASLRVQLGMSLSVVREWLWDPHLVLAGYDPDRVRELLRPVAGRNKVVVTGDKPGRVLWSMGADRVIILRPDAPEPLRDDEARVADAFLIGGIVDRIPRPGVSRSLDSKVPWGVPRRIELRGSTLGVPHRLNRIIEILLKARFAGLSLEKAIVSSMTRRDRVLRLMRELARASRGSRRRVSLRELESIRRWLPFTCEELMIAARKARVEVEPGACGEG